MKKSRFSEEEIVAILAEADRGEKKIGDVCRAHGVSEPTFYKCRKRFRGMGVEEVREYRELKRENARLKRVLADRELPDRRDEGGDAKETVTPQARRNCVQAMVELQVSERRSCELVGMSRSGYRYRHVMREGDEKMKAELRAIAGEHPTAGYRTAWALLRREGLPVNHKRVQRLWREAGLAQPRKRRRRRRRGKACR